MIDKARYVQKYGCEELHKLVRQNRVNVSWAYLFVRMHPDKSQQKFILDCGIPIAQSMVKDYFRPQKKERDPLDCFDDFYGKLSAAQQDKFAAAVTSGDFRKMFGRGGKYHPPNRSVSS